MRSKRATFRGKGACSENLGEYPMSPVQPVTPQRATDVMVMQSPIPDSCSSRRPIMHPQSPFGSFASNLPSLNSCEPSHGGFSAHPPASPFSSFTSSLPNLTSSPAAMTPVNTWLPAEPSPASKCMFLSPSGWQPASKARRSLIGDDIAGMEASDSSKMNHTPRMQLITFGECSLSEMLLSPISEPSIIGTFGQFMSGSKRSNVTTSFSLASSKSKKKKSQPSTRQKLETKLETLECMENLTPPESMVDEADDVEQVASSEAQVEDLFDEVESARKAEEQEEIVESKHRVPMSSKMSKTTSAQPAPPAPTAQSAPKVPRDASKLCKCKKSKCIRQYCVCFRAGELCEGCDCVECLNDGTHEEERNQAIEHIKTSDPLAFSDKVRVGDTVPSKAGVANPVVKAEKDVPVDGVHHVRGCKCRNSRCQKKYCECFEFGVSCSAKCGCKDCANGKPPQSDGSGAADRKRKVGAVEVRSERLSERKKLCMEGEADKQNSTSNGQSDKAVVNTKSTFKPSAFAPVTPQRVDAVHQAPYTPVDQAQAAINFSERWFASPGLSETKDTNVSPADPKDMPTPSKCPLPCSPGPKSWPQPVK